MTRTTRRNLLFAGTAGTALALGGAAALLTAAPTTAAAWFGHRGRHFGHGPFGHGGFHGEHDPEALERHLRRGVGFMLAEVDATDEQIEAVAVVLGAAFADLHALRESHAAQREAFGEALAAPEIDRDALEALRAEAIGRFAEASRRFVTALADAADVLTPGQREELLALHDRFHGRGWMR